MVWMTAPARKRLRAGIRSVSRVVLHCPFALLLVKIGAQRKVLLWVRALAIIHHSAAALKALLIYSLAHGPGLQATCAALSKSCGLAYQRNAQRSMRPCAVLICAVSWCIPSRLMLAAAATCQRVPKRNVRASAPASPTPT